MALLNIPDKSETLRDFEQVTRYLAGIGIDYERWEPSTPVRADAPPQEILDAYATQIETLKQQGGYVAADVIDVNPSTPGLEQMLAKFNREHWHDEDEVRFIIHGRGLFHIRPIDGPVVGIEVEAGDLIRVPRGTKHWFNLCAEREIRAIRLFQDPAGWTPQYTESGVDAGYQPVCLGATHVPAHGGTSL
jgi:1,2-dihydroxy-3-keto-5-methylthiopentene dioxygenase